MEKVYNHEHHRTIEISPFRHLSVSNKRLFYSPKSMLKQNCRAFGVTKVTKHFNTLGQLEQPQKTNCITLTVYISLYFMIVI